MGQIKKMRQVPFTSLDITGGFWKDRQEQTRSVTMNAVYDRFKETGRFDATRCDWTPDKGDRLRPHIFWDSDIAKWMEAVGYFLEKGPDADFERIVDETVDAIATSQEEDGYYNQYYCTFKEEKRFSDRGCHELYCLGHLIEAAVAYYKATGKDKLLQVVEKYTDLVIRVFYEEKSAGFFTPGHEEIELALVKLYDLTGEKKYLDLSKYFVDFRGVYESEKEVYCQSLIPVREQSEAVGHSVRAVYLYSAMADLAHRCEDEELFAACRRLFENVVNRRMYLTGGIGSSSCGEKFSFDYDLPNVKAYAESCAAIGLAFFCRRMQLLDVDSVYGDVAERILYNGFLSSVSLDGRSFFYENPLEIDPKMRKREGEHYPITQRVEVFSCSCCPPNIVRFIASLGDFLYTASDEDNTLYLHQYITSDAKIAIAGGEAQIAVESGFPYDGKVRVTYHGPAITLAVRLPDWCAKIGFSSQPSRCRKGYAYYSVSDGDVLDFDFEMSVQFVESSPHVHDNCGRIAVMRGPIVWCAEAVDNGEDVRDISLDRNAGFELDFDTSPLKEYGIPTLNAAAYRRLAGDFHSLYSFASPRRQKFDLKLIPYFAFANRGETEMMIWLLG